MEELLRGDDDELRCNESDDDDAVDDLRTEESDSTLLGRLGSVHDAPLRKSSAKFAKLDLELWFSQGGEV